MIRTDANAITNTSVMPARTVRLRVSDGAVTRVVDLTGGRQVVGRTAVNGIVLASPAVSREHAELYCDSAGRWHIRDMNSRNGTWINDRRVTDSILNPGEECRIGPFTLTLEDPGRLSSFASPTRSFLLSEVAPTTMRRLSEFPSPKIGASHHTLITDFGRHLVELASAEDRLGALCSLMVHAEFHAVSAMVVRLNRDGQLEAMCDVKYADARVRSDPPHVSRTLLKAVLEQGVPVLASSIPTADMALDVSVSIDTHEIAAIACPLHRDESACEILYATFPAAFGTGEWLALISLAAGQHQQAESNIVVRQQQVHRAALERELASARKVQMRLVPDRGRMAALTGFDVGISFEPCKQVGGDYVDACTTADGRILLVLADVSGKGMPAALVTSMMHTMVNTLVRDSQSLAQLMTRINEHLCDHLDPTMFVTAFAALTDPGTGQMECLNAGHPPAFLVGADGAVRELQVAENYPLGIDRSPMTSQRERIEPGETLIVYSDGLSEMRDPSGRLLGSARIARELAGICHGCGAAPAGSIVERIAQYVLSVEDHSTASDDRTFLVARRLAGQHAATA